MPTAADLLANINKARAQVREAEREEGEARKVLRTATDKLKAANKRYLTAIDEALDENRQPNLFDVTEPAPAAPAPAAPAPKPPAKKKAGPKLPPGMPTPKAVGELPLADLPGMPLAAVHSLKHEKKVTTLGGLVALIEIDPTPNLTEHQRLVTAMGAINGELASQAADAVLDHLRPGRTRTSAPGKLAEPVGPTEADVAATIAGDETEAWLRRANDGAKGTGQDPKRLKRQIAEYRDDQAANNAHPMWNHWSEFFVLLLTNGKDTGDRVRVLSKPEWDGEKGRHHIEFWHSRISETGYWSIVTPKVGAMLVEWCREHIQKQADEYQAGRNAKPTPPPPEQKAVTRLSEIPNIPDAVLDLFLVKGISTLPTLLERVEGLGANAELPLRNRIVAYLVNQMVKLKPAENAADAIANHVAAGDKPPVKIIDVLNLPKPKRTRKPKAVAQ